MKKLQEIAKKYATATVKKVLGDDDEKAKMTREQADALRQDLLNTSKRNGAIFWVIFVIVIILFIASVLFVVFNQVNPEKIKVVFGITGVSVMGLVYYMVTMWKEKNYIDMVLILIRTMEPDKINAILSTIITSKL